MRIALACILLQLVISNQLSGQNIIGFAPYYRSFSEEFDFSYYTHIHFFAVWPDSTGDLLWPGTHDSISLHEKFEEVKSRAMESGNKVLITFGGTSGGGSLYFNHLTKDSSSTERFALKAVELCNSWGADGIDIDWEWGMKLDSDQKDLKMGYLKLMTRLKELADQEDLLLSTDVSASSWFGDNYPVDGVDQADYINVMSYTYNGAWSSTANHHSPLAKTESIGLSYWKGRGISASKLNIGVPFYGIEYAGATSPGAAFTSVKKLTVTEVRDRISSGYLVVDDPENGSYCYSESSILFYESPANLALKVQYVKENAYQGIFIWEIGQDDPSQSLSGAIYSAMNDLTFVPAINSLPDQNYQINLLSGTGIEITTQSKEVFNAHLFSLEGKKMANCYRNYQYSLISTNGFPGGMYILVINRGNTVYNQKIIVND